MDVINSIINTTLESFDFGYCLTVNIFTYLLIKELEHIKKHKLKTWYKRVCLLISICLLVFVYYIIGSDLKLLINSSILAPVSWSWIFKPISKYINKMLKENA